MESLFKGIYKDKRVLVTGHTGFKGSWLVLWLNEMGAHVAGLSKDKPTNPCHADLINSNLESAIIDIRDKQLLTEYVQSFQPEIVFHLAAQALVRVSYKDPYETYTSNVIGSLNVYEACRLCNSVKAIVSITTDKVYKNKESIDGYDENDELGGYDPYSASKACAEILTSSYRDSFLNLKKYKHDHNILMATARAGNVIGGGDWAEDRLIPDIARAAYRNEEVIIRNPDATRPWQHVLEPLAGYLILGQKLLEKKVEYSGAWNFGPSNNDGITVEDILKIVQEKWNGFNYKIKPDISIMHETKLLLLDSSKATKFLDWQPIWDKDPIEPTIEWYKKYYLENNVISVEQLNSYVENAINKGLAWTKK